MIVYQTDAQGYLLGVTDADPSPLEPGVHLIPAGCVEVAPPADIAEGHRARWNGQGWDVEPLPVPEPPAPTPRDLAAKARRLRDTRLSASDWTQLPDAPVDRAAWAMYRQALRDLPSQPGWPASITWPPAPV